MWPLVGVKRFYGRAKTERNLYLDPVYYAFKLTSSKIGQSSVSTCIDCKYN